MVLEDRNRQYRDECPTEYRDAQAASFSHLGGVKLKELRASSPAASCAGEAAKKRRRSMTRRRREGAEWYAAHKIKVDESIFTTEVLPNLQRLPLSQVSAATGLSQQYCLLIRWGLKVPHHRHWEAFRQAISREDWSHGHTSNKGNQRD